MPEDLYSDNPGGDAAPDTAPDKNKAGDEGETALLPKSILAGKEFKLGEEVVLKIVKIYEDEVEVAYAKGEDSKESEHPEMDEANSEMDKMASNPGPGGY
jgi:hypothetical protein